MTNLNHTSDDFLSQLEINLANSLRDYRFNLPNSWENLTSAMSDIMNTMCLSTQEFIDHVVNVGDDVGMDEDEVMDLDYTIQDWLSYKN